LPEKSCLSDRLPEVWLLISRLSFLYIFLLLCGVMVSCDFSRIDSLNGNIKVADGYEWEVFASGLRDVDNLARTSDGVLFATFERDFPKGELVMIDRNGEHTSVMKGLNRPDGLRASGSKLYIIEESANGRVIEYDTGTFKEETIARLNNVEGIAVTSGNEILVAEDKMNGRLINLSRSGDETVLLEKLHNPEGLAVNGDGTVYIAETKAGRVLGFKDGNVETLLEGLNEPDQLAIDRDGVLWISEDAHPGRLLRYHRGKVETVVSGLNEPQGILIDGRDILLSEQKANRIIRLRKKQQRAR